MAQINGGELLVRVLQACGVQAIFTLHGGHLDSVYQALRGSNIRVVDQRHEQACGIAANGWSRVTGEVGVAMVTAGGGVTNLVTAAANAYADCVATLLLGGAPPLRDLDALPVNSGVDHISVMRGVTKYCERITNPELLPEIVAKAFHVAQSGRPGPVYLDLPTDVLFATIAETDVEVRSGKTRFHRPAPGHNFVQDAVAALRGAKRPVILAGGGVVYAKATEQLRHFVALTGIPVLTNNKSRGVLPTTSSLWGRGFSSIAGAVARGHAPDVVFLLGARQGLYMGGRRGSVIPADATVIQVDISGEELGRMRETDLAAQADCGEALAALCRAAVDGPWQDLTAWCAQLTQTRSPNGDADVEASLCPSRLAQVVAAAAPDGAILVADGGETPAWFDAAAVNTEPRRWLAHGYLGLMGEGLPLAIGAQVANPSARVICLTGDGAIGFNLAEFDTMVRHGLPVVVVVNNDRMWAMSAHGQDLIYGRPSRMATELRASRYDLVAAAFGAHAEHVERLEDLPAALSRALASGLPACINVLTDASEIAPVTRRFVGDAAEGLIGADGKARIPYTDKLQI